MVLEAADGRDGGRATIEREAPDLMILDMYLPVGWAGTICCCNSPSRIKIWPSPGQPPDGYILKDCHGLRRAWSIGSISSGDALLQRSESGLMAQCRLIAPPPSFTKLADHLKKRIGSERSLRKSNCSKPQPSDVAYRCVPAQACRGLNRQSADDRHRRHQFVSSPAEQAVPQTQPGRGTNHQPWHRRAGVRSGKPGRGDDRQNFTGTDRVPPVIRWPANASPGPPAAWSSLGTFLQR